MSANFESGLFSNILTPGSSLHPTFLLILDAIFATLLVVLLGLVYATAFNFHLIALTVIELALWASVKWFVYELKNAPHVEEDSKKNS
ncbi:ER protein Pkr1-domain-containing protein [Rhodocollybia butyracea]|uniref:ER protein Pkr1-domain-containing protein n=1 Tax=Rhodocollybia butyracea TaxID=206335 RepID=A0A9P5UEM6_9AGAR|nr:ER protein Pkr1-domain-containing protein [Rhodocollybia butyracea]